MSRLGKPMLKRALWVALLAFVMLVPATAYWLLHTASGAAMLWSQAKSASAGAVDASSVDGDLASGFVIHDLAYRADDTDLLVRQLEVKAGIQWWPASVQVRDLVLQDVSIVTRTPATAPRESDGETDIRSLLASLDLPFVLEVQKAEVNNVRLQQNDLAPQLLVETFTLRARVDDQLVIDQLNFNTPEIAVQASANLALKPPFDLVAGLEGQIALTDQEGSAGQSLALALDVTGDLDKLQINLVNDQYALHLAGEVLNPLSEPVWNISGGSEDLQWPADNSEDAVHLSGLSFASQGKLADWSYSMESTAGFGALPTLHLNVSGTGSTDRVRVTQATVSGPSVEAGFKGEVYWSPAIEAGLNAQIEQLDLSPWLSDWPAGESLASAFELSWSEAGLKITTGRLSLMGTDTAISIGADIDLDNNAVAASLNWKNLAWPLHQAKADFSSSAGSLKVSGSVDEWVINGSLGVRAGDYPPGHLEVQGNGTGELAHFTLLNGEVLGGTLGGDASVNWKDGLSWRAAIQSSDIHLEPLFPQWPGQLDAAVKVNADSRSDLIHIEILSLEGKVRDVPLTAHGAVTMEGEELKFSGVEIRTDESVLRLDGDFTDASGAAVTFSGNLPSSLLRGASGIVELEGRYSANPQHPLAQLQLAASDLAWDGMSLKTLTLNTEELHSRAPIPAFKARASGFISQDTLIDELSLSFMPENGQHRLQAQLTSQNTSLSSALIIVPADSNDPLNGPWHGVFEVLDIAVSDTYNFALEKPGLFDWSAGAIRVQPFCMHEARGAGMCVSGEYKTSGAWSLSADARAIPLNYLQDMLDMGVHFEQLLEGHLEWHQSGGQAPTGGADFRITAGRILDLEDNEMLLETNEGTLSFALRNGNLEAGILDLEFPGVGFIDVDFDVLDIAENGARILQGRVVTQMDDIHMIGQLAMPGLDHIGGKLVSNIALTGPIDDVVFDGGLKLSNGFVQYNPIGLKLEDIEFEGSMVTLDRGHIEGQFRAGKGLGSINGDFLFDDLENLQLDMVFSGDQLLLVNTDELKIETETNLKLGLSKHRIDIDGRIAIPHARITPSNLLVEKVSDSEDLVVEGAVDEKAVAGKDPASQMKIYGQLEVLAGDDVFMKVTGVESNISGSAVFNWSGPPVPIGDGGYSLRGKVDLYGPTLHINNGHINFPGVPADNPTINIRAEREVFGNTQIRAAGVQVVGTAKQSVLEAYTVPITNEDRAWTLLVTGTDFDQGQGVGGFDVGTYIAPRLYVSYGISLFEDENVVSARYDLKKGFGVKVTSGQRETGVDVSYTVDR